MQRMMLCPRYGRAIATLFCLVGTMVMINSIGEALQDAFDLRRAQK